VLSALAVGESMNFSIGMNSELVVLTRGCRLVRLR